MLKYNSIVSAKLAFILLFLRLVRCVPYVKYCWRNYKALRQLTASAYTTINIFTVCHQRFIFLRLALSAFIKFLCIEYQFSQHIIVKYSLFYFIDHILISPVSLSLFNCCFKCNFLSFFVRVASHGWLCHHKLSFFM